MALWKMTKEEEEKYNIFDETCKRIGNSDEFKKTMKIGVKNSSEKEEAEDKGKSGFESDFDWDAYKKDYEEFTDWYHG